jgi:hypothetical protein
MRMSAVEIIGAYRVAPQNPVKNCRIPDPRFEGAEGQEKQCKI